MPANHFPTPGIGAGLLLAPSAQNVIAFRASAVTTSLHRQRPGRHATRRKGSAKLKAS
jgi:hypothetical protein